MTGIAVIPVGSSDALAQACTRVIAGVAALDDPRHDPLVFDVVARCVTAGGDVAQALWGFHLEATDRFADQIKRLGNADIALAGQVIADAMHSHPAGLDRDERFFFMASYLNTVLHPLWCEASPAQKPDIPLPFVRDVVFPALLGKIVMLQSLHADGLPTAPRDWPGTATYPPQYPIYVNMMLAHLDTALVADMDDADGEACLEQARLIREYLAVGSDAATDGPLLAGVDIIRPVDVPWAWRPSGAALLADLSKTYPDEIWFPYRS